MRPIYKAIGLSLVYSIALAIIGIVIMFFTVFLPSPFIMLAFLIFPLLAILMSGVPAALVATYYADVYGWRRWIFIALWTAAWLLGTNYLQSLLPLRP